MSVVGCWDGCTPGAANLLRRKGWGGWLVAVFGVKMWLFRYACMKLRLMGAQGACSSEVRFDPDGARMVKWKVWKLHGETRHDRTERERQTRGTDNWRNDEQPTETNHTESGAHLWLQTRIGGDWCALCAQVSERARAVGSRGDWRFRLEYRTTTVYIYTIHTNSNRQQSGEAAVVARKEHRDTTNSAHDRETTTHHQQHSKNAKAQHNVWELYGTMNARDTSWLRPFVE